MNHRTRDLLAGVAYVALFGTSHVILTAYLTTSAAPRTGVACGLACVVFWLAFWLIYRRELARDRLAKPWAYPPLRQPVAVLELKDWRATAPPDTYPTTVRRAIRALARNRRRNRLPA